MVRQLGEGTLWWASESRRPGRVCRRRGARRMGGEGEEDSPPPLQRLLRQYLYFFTSRASQLSTSSCGVVREVLRVV